MVFEEIKIDFIKSMDDLLILNKKTKCDSWKSCDMQFLIDKLKEEFEEVLEEHLRLQENESVKDKRYTIARPVDLMKECADLANVCQFIWMRCKEIIEKKWKYE